MDLSALGTPQRPMIFVNGGFANRMYRLDTEQGSFAIKKLNLIDRRDAYHAEDVFRLEQMAFAAGIPMPEPIMIRADTLVHRWVEGEVVPEAPVSEEFATEIGEILARLHALDLDWTPVPDDGPAARDWPSSPNEPWRPGSGGPTNWPPRSARCSPSPSSSTPAREPVRTC